MIRTERLRKVYFPPRSAPVEGVKSATLAVEPGEIFGLLGPNGAGKTTLLRMLGTIIVPTSGHCWIAGLRTDQNPDAVRQHIGFLSGNTKLYGRLTAREELRYFGYLHGLSKERIRRRTEELVEILGMEEFIDRRCDTLSTGQSQKVSIGRVLLHDPEVLILDEPTGPGHHDLPDHPHVYPECEAFGPQHNFLDPLHDRSGDPVRSAGVHPPWRDSRHGRKGESIREDGHDEPDRRVCAPGQ